jgi:hypothetical protein
VVKTALGRGGRHIVEMGKALYVKRYHDRGVIGVLAISGAVGGSGGYVVFKTSRCDCLRTRPILG